jgi:hypothetical protein
MGTDDARCRRLLDEEAKRRMGTGAVRVSRRQGRRSGRVMGRIQRSMATVRRGMGEGKSKGMEGKGGEQAR